MPAKGIQVGGQAVIEGVMMRSKDYFSIAVRRRDGNDRHKKNGVTEAAEVQ